MWKILYSTVWPLLFEPLRRGNTTYRIGQSTSLASFKSCFIVIVHLLDFIPTPFLPTSQLQPYLAILDSKVSQQTLRQPIKCYILLDHTYELFKETHTDYSYPSVLSVPICGELLCFHVEKVVRFVVCQLSFPQNKGFSWSQMCSNATELYYAKALWSYGHSASIHYSSSTDRTNAVCCKDNTCRSTCLLTCAQVHK